MEAYIIHHGEHAYKHRILNENELVLVNEAQWEIPSYQNK